MSKLSRAIQEVREHLQLNSDPDATDEDALDDLLGECGKQPDGSCLEAGTEYCDFECPFS
jgi:hypothetical protein